MNQSKKYVISMTFQWKIYAVGTKVCFKQIKYNNLDLIENSGKNAPPDEKRNPIGKTTNPTPHLSKFSPVPSGSGAYFLYQPEVDLYL